MGGVNLGNGLWLVKGSARQRHGPAFKVTSTRREFYMIGKVELNYIRTADWSELIYIILIG